MKSTDMRRKHALKVSGARPVEAPNFPPPVSNDLTTEEKGQEEASRDAILRVFLEKTNMVAYRYEVAKD